MTTYVIGADHHNTLGVIRALGKKGIKPVLLLYPAEAHSYVSKSAYVEAVHPFESSDALVDFLKDADRHGCIITCSDETASVIDMNRYSLSGRFFLPGAEEQGSITNLMDKSRMTELAAGCGLCTPESITLDTSDGVAPEWDKFPCIVKPLVSKDGVKQDIAICHDMDELKAALEVSSCRKVQVQEFIDKDFEFQLIGLSLKDRIIIPGVSRIIRSASNTNTGFLRYITSGEIQYDHSPVEKFIRATGFTGLFSVEFLRGHNGKDYFMEMNFRNDGNATAVEAAGINLPYIWCLDAEGKDYADEISRPLHDVVVMPEIDDFKFAIRNGVGFRNWLKDVKSTDRFMEFDSDDKKPFFSLLARTVIQLSKKLCHRKSC